MLLCCLVAVVAMTNRCNDPIGCWWGGAGTSHQCRRDMCVSQCIISSTRFHTATYVLHCMYADTRRKQSSCPPARTVSASSIRAGSVWKRTTRRLQRRPRRAGGRRTHTFWLGRCAELPRAPSWLLHAGYRLYAFWPARSCVSRSHQTAWQKSGEGPPCLNDSP